MTQAIAHHSLDETKERMQHHATVLREYAKWCLIRGHAFPHSRESQRRELMRQFWEMGTEVRLTERDMVLLLYRGLFSGVSPASR